MITSDITIGEVWSRRQEIQCIRELTIVWEHMLKAKEHADACPYPNEGLQLFQRTAASMCSEVEAMIGEIKRDAVQTLNS